MDDTITDGSTISEDTQTIVEADSEDNSANNSAADYSLKERENYKQKLGIANDEVMGNDDPDSEHTFSDLDHKIFSTPAGGTVDLEKKYTYKQGEASKGIVIDKDITIN